jgi:hypothetical protein
MTAHRTSPLAHLVALVALSALSGCMARELSGHFADNGYYHLQRHYRVRLATDRPRALLPAPWRIAGFETDENGEPTRQRRVARQSLFHLGDMGGESTTLYDFVYRSPERGAVWALTAPLPAGLAGRQLDEVVIEGLYHVRIPWRFILGDRFAGQPSIELRERGRAVIDGEEAHLTTLDLRIVDHAGAIERRITIVAVRPPTERRAQHEQRDHVVFFACASSPERHEDERAEFEAMLRRVDFAR